MPVALDWKAIEQLMMEVGIDSRDDFAERCSVHKSQMYRLSKGRSQPSLSVIGRMCYHLRCHPGALLSYTRSDADASPPYRVFDKVSVDKADWKKFIEDGVQWAYGAGLVTWPPTDSDEEKLERYNRARLSFSALNVEYGKFKQAFFSPKVQQNQTRRLAVWAATGFTGELETEEHQVETRESFLWCMEYQMILLVAGPEQERGERLRDVLRQNKQLSELEPGESLGERNVMLKDVQADFEDLAVKMLVDSGYQFPGPSTDQGGAEESAETELRAELRKEFDA